MNMKYKSLAAIMLASTAFSAMVISIPARAEATTVSGGTIHFTGEVVNAACAVSTGTDDQTVALGQVRSASLATAGAVANQKEFSINLIDCDSDIAKTAGVTFNGAANSDGNSLAPRSITTPGVAATKVGIQILGADGQVLKPNSGVSTTSAKLNSGTNKLPFTAQFVSMGAATPGAADADATFNIIYN